MGCQTTPPAIEKQQAAAAGTSEIDPKIAAKIDYKKWLFGFPNGLQKYHDMKVFTLFFVEEKKFVGQFQARCAPHRTKGE